MQRLYKCPACENYSVQLVSQALDDSGSYETWGICTSCPSELDIEELNLSNYIEE